jgi:hypothetical protein
MKDYREVHGSSPYGKKKIMNCRKNGILKIGSHGSGV